MGGGGGWGGRYKKKSDSHSTIRSRSRSLTRLEGICLLMRTRGRISALILHTRPITKHGIIIKKKKKGPLNRLMGVKKVSK